MKPSPFHPVAFFLKIATVCFVNFAAATATSASTASDSLPWEKDYASALAKAKAEKRPIFLMLTATWCGPCKMLESQTLPNPMIRSGMKEFVWFTVAIPARHSAHARRLSRGNVQSENI